MEYRCNFSFSEIVDTGCLKTNDCVTTYLGLPSWNHNIRFAPWPATTETTMPSI